MKKGIGIVLLLVLVPLSLLTLFFGFLNQPVNLWHCEGGETGIDTLEITSNPFLTGYKISIEDYFEYFGDYEYGNITFTHNTSGTKYTFWYDLGHLSDIGTESNSTVFNLLPGIYMINWYNNKVDPDYYLTQVSFMHPNEPLIIIVGVALLAIGIIVPISIIYKAKKSS